MQLAWIWAATQSIDLLIVKAEITATVDDIKTRFNCPASRKIINVARNFLYDVCA